MKQPQQDLLQRQELPYEERFASALAQIQQGLETFLTSEYLTEGAPAPLSEVLPVTAVERFWEALRYSTLAGGKRIRPLLAVETCRAFGGKIEDILPTACAIELVHAQSLIHDDLPCMDNDDLRRGQPTVHRAFDESTAVLAGDALLGLAFGLIARHTQVSERVTPMAILQVIRDFSDAAGIRGLVNGQFVDIYYEGKEFDSAALEYIHTFKTAALFVFSTRSGARLAGASEPMVEVMSRFGQKLGLAFQIVDDLLDVQSDSQTLGKTAGKDIAQKKATYPAFYGETRAQEQAEALLQEAHLLLDTMTGIDPEPLKTLTQFIGARIR